MCMLLCVTAGMCMCRWWPGGKLGSQFSLSTLLETGSLSLLINGVCVCVQCPQMPEREHQILQHLELQVVVHLLMWVLGVLLWFSERTAHVLKH